MNEAIRSKLKDIEAGRLTDAEEVRSIFREAKRAISKLSHVMGELDDDYCDAREAWCGNPDKASDCGPV